MGEHPTISQIRLTAEIMSRCLWGERPGEASITSRSAAVARGWLCAFNNTS